MSKETTRDAAETVFRAALAILARETGMNADQIATILFEELPSEDVETLVEALQKKLAEPLPF